MSVSSNFGPALWLGQNSTAVNKQTAKPDAGVPKPIVIYSLDDLYAVTSKTIGGIVFRSTDDLTLFYEGKVERGTLLYSTNINGTKYKHGTKIEFYPSGKVKSGILADNATLNGVVYKDGTLLERSRDGKVEHGTLGADWRIRQGVLKPGTEVFFDEKGKLSGVILSVRTKIGAIIFSTESIYQHAIIRLLFHKNGRVKGGLLSADASIQGTAIQGIVCKFDSWVEFHDNGRLKCGILAQDSVIEGHKRKAGALVKFDRQGAFIKNNWGY